jgi:hypothetical protein
MNPITKTIARLERGIDRLEWDQKDPIRGAHATPIESFVTPTLEADDLTELGIAGGKRWYSRRDQELRVDRRLTSMERGGLLPRDSVIVHSTEILDKHVVTEEGADPWKPGERVQIPRQVVDVWRLATILPAGSYADEEGKDVAMGAKVQRRKQDSAEARRRREIGARRQKMHAAWLSGEHVDGLPD